MNYLYIMIYLLFTSLGLILFKIGAADNLKISLSNGAFNFRMGYVSILGIFCYFASFLIYLGLVSKLQLSYLFPVTTGILQIVILIASAYVFHEHISVSNIIGVVLIILGVFFISI